MWEHCWTRLAIDSTCSSHKLPLGLLTIDETEILTGTFPSEDIPISMEANERKQMDLPMHSGLFPLEQMPANVKLRKNAFEPCAMVVPVVS